MNILSTKKRETEDVKEKDIKRTNPSFFFVADICSPAHLAGLERLNYSTNHSSNQSIFSPLLGETGTFQVFTEMTVTGLFS